MNTHKTIIDLARESRDLILEFIEEESLISDSSIKEITIAEGGKDIYVEDLYTGLQIYCLTEISNVFKMSMRGFGPCSASFYDALDITLSEIENDYKTMTKEEFINHIGKLHYMKYRCEEIYKKLENIEKEASSII